MEEGPIHQAILIRFIADIPANELKFAHILCNARSAMFQPEQGILSRLHSATLSVIELDKKMKKIIYESHKSYTLFHGTMTTGNDVVKVTVKFAPRKRLRQEAKVYDKFLGLLEGNVVPKFYGTFSTNETQGQLWNVAETFSIHPVQTSFDRNSQYSLNY